MVHWILNRTIVSSSKVRLLLQTTGLLVFLIFLARSEDLYELSLVSQARRLFYKLLVRNLHLG